MSDASVTVRSASKTFRLSRSEVSFAESLLRLFRPSLRRTTEVVALRDVDLDLGPGDWVGIVGDNGAGKSTLLRLLAGIHAPSTGSVEVRGTAALLAGFGTGMIDELSVEENVYLYASIYGLRRARVAALLPETLSWAEVTAFRTARLATLSTGMKSRLAFSILRHLEVDVLFLDEALSAGDRRFRDRCLEHFDQAKRTQLICVVASHDLGFVREYCSLALWLERGRVKDQGPVERVLEGYRRETSGASAVLVPAGAGSHR